MNETNPEILRKVKQWLVFADEDLRIAVKTLDDTENCPYRLVAYHAQQCSEKYLKAFLVFHSIDFPYTHNIRRLLKLCAEKADWTGRLENAAELTSYAITARYPGEDADVSGQEAVQAVEIAQLVRKQIRKSLKQLGVDISS